MFAKHIRNYYAVQRAESIYGTHALCLWLSRNTDDLVDTKRLAEIWNIDILDIQDITLWKLNRGHPVIHDYQDAIGSYSANLRYELIEARPEAKIYSDNHKQAVIIGDHHPNKIMLRDCFNLKCELLTGSEFGIRIGEGSYWITPSWIIQSDAVGDFRLLE